MLETPLLLNMKTTAGHAVTEESFYAAQPARLPSTSVVHGHNWTVRPMVHGAAPTASRPMYMWKLISLLPKPKLYKEEDDLEALEVAVRGIGRRMADQMHVDRFGAYIADDERYDYYMFKCTVAPKQADKDEVFEFDGNEFPVKEGELYCEGVWLAKLPNTSEWYVVTNQRCIVRMQVVVDADVNLLPWSGDNQFRSNLNREVARKAKENGALKITDEDHSFLMEEARQRTALDYEDYVYESDEDDSDIDADDASIEEDEELSEVEYD